MKLLVTGANGFLGRRVVNAAVEAGHDVRALIRPATSTASLAWGTDVDVYRADLRGGRDLEEAFADVDALIHLAAGVKGTEEQQFQSTVAGTERLLEAMSRSRTRRLVLASSFYVYDWQAARGEINEDTPVVADPYARDGYTIAKVWQERVARRFSDTHKWELVVLRPGFIWGAGNPWPARVGLPVAHGLLVVGPRSDAGLTHVENCAAYFVRAAECHDATGRTFNVFDGHRISNWRFAGQFARHQPTLPWRVPCPYLLGRADFPVCAVGQSTALRPTGKAAQPARAQPVPGALPPAAFSEYSTDKSLGSTASLL